MEFSLADPQTPRKEKTLNDFAQEIHDFDINTATHGDLDLLFSNIFKFVDVSGMRSHSPVSHTRKLWMDDTPSSRHWSVFYTASRTSLLLHHSLTAEERDCGLNPRSTQWFQIRAELCNVFAVCIDSFQRYVSAIENENIV